MCGVDARDAMFNDLYVVIAVDCVASDDREQHEASLLLMRHRFDMATADEIAGVWAASPRPGAREAESRLVVAPTRSSGVPMIIADVLAVPVRAGFFADDQAAIRAGAAHDGFTYSRTPLTPGFRTIRQPGEAVSVLLVLDDGQIAHGDCAAVQYSGVGGRAAVFRAAPAVDVIERHVAPLLRGRAGHDVSRACARGRRARRRRRAAACRDQLRRHPGAARCRRTDTRA